MRSWRIQDNPVSWFDWSRPDEGMLAYTRRLVAFRRAHPVFRRRRFLVGIEAAELAWFTPSATPMTMENWADPNARALTIYLEGGDSPDLAEDGTPLLDDDFLVLVNGWWEKLTFRIPDVGAASPGTSRWTPTTLRPPPARRACAPETTSRWAPSASWCCRARAEGDGGAAACWGAGRAGGVGHGLGAGMSAGAGVRGSRSEAASPRRPTAASTIMASP